MQDQYFEKAALELEKELSVETLFSIPNVRNIFRDHFYSEILDRAERMRNSN